MMQVEMLRKAADSSCILIMRKCYEFSSLNHRYSQCSVINLFVSNQSARCICSHEIYNSEFSTRIFIINPCVQLVSSWMSFEASQQAVKIVFSIALLIAWYLLSLVSRSILLQKLQNNHISNADALISISRCNWFISDSTVTRSKY